MAQLTSAPQADLAQLTQLQCLSGEVIITRLLAAMLLVFPVIQLHQVQLQLMLAIQTVQPCTLNLVQTTVRPGAQILEAAQQPELLADLPQA